jgi:DNA (cytosine-5)-methyltransferase 1
VWPKPTHGPKGSKPYRTAAECIDWSIPVPSIFDRKKPLADATQRRIAEGIRRYVLEAKRPFLVNLTHGGRLESIDEPFKTVTGAHRGEKALVTPPSSFGRTCRTCMRGVAIDEPLRAPSRRRKAGRAIVATTLIQTGYGERRVSVRARSTSNRRSAPSSPADRSTVSSPHSWRSTTAASSVSRSIRRSERSREGSSLAGRRVTDEVLRHVRARIADRRAGTDDHRPSWRRSRRSRRGIPLQVLRLRRARRSSALDDPMHTVTTKDRLGLVTVTIDGEEFVIADIGMRMLQPRELARAQGFPDRYILTGTKSAQVARIGNSVCPDVAAAIVSANLENDEAEVAA